MYNLDKKVGKGPYLEKFRTALCLFGKGFESKRSSFENYWQDGKMTKIQASEY